MASDRRKARGGPKTERVVVLMNAQQRRSAQKAADRAGIPLSRFCREAVLARAAREGAA